MNYEYKQVIVVRKDLKMRMGKTAAQVAHASMAVLLDHPDHPHIRGWLAGRFAKIVVYVNSEDELLDMEENALNAGLLNALITDAGFTEFNGVPTHTCIAIGPAPIEEINQVTGHLPLL